MAITLVCLDTEYEYVFFHLSIFMSVSMILHGTWININFKISQHNP